jgi:hypothetical protein
MKRFEFALRLMVLSAVACGLLISNADAQSRRSRTKTIGPFSTGSSDEIIKFIDEQVRQGWEDNEVTPSRVADDAEWLRRVHLDIIGRIPEGSAVIAFLKSDDPAKRSKIIETLLDDDAYVRYMTANWTNLSIGRRTPRRVSRAGMQKFYREAFARNRPWNEVVFDLISAEGRFDENGATNFLLAQIQGGRNTDDEYAVTATAKTTKLFMGIQVQCTQCHDHPFNDWKQDQFWQFNSFFRQVRRVNHRKPDPKTGRMVDDYSELLFVDYNKEGVFFEKRSGEMRVAYPQYFGIKVNPGRYDDDGNPIDRRKELAKIAIQGEKPWIAMAMVNRMWGHFFGYGFTKPIDDMGPHNPASHPELHDRLSKEFVKGSYDVKQLVRWICNSEAYNLTSQYNLAKKNHLGNEIDNPGAGEVPLFSHMYVKSMQAEQLYDSLIVATNAHKSGRSNWDQAERQRQRWMQQFVIAFGTDEGDETTTFNGTIPQALMMMNGELVSNATSADRGSYLREVLEKSGSDVTKIRQLYLTALGRAPSRTESLTAGRLLKSSKDKLAAYQDLFWALLNSNEFIFVH